MEETADAIVERMSLRPNVGAVIVDFVVNINYISLQKCVEYITKNDALFLVGAWDPVIPFRGLNLIGKCNYCVNYVQNFHFFFNRKFTVCKDNHRNHR